MFAYDDPLFSMLCGGVRMLWSYVNLQLAEVNCSSEGTVNNAQMSVQNT